MLSVMIVSLFVGIVMGFLLSNSAKSNDDNCPDSQNGSGDSLSCDEVYEAFRAGIQIGVSLPNHRYVEIAGGQPALTNGGGGVKFLIDQDDNGYGLYDIIRDDWYDPLTAVAVSARQGNRVMNPDTGQYEYLS